MPSQDQLWPIPTRFSTFTPLIDPDRVGKKLANGFGPVLQQKLMLLWGKATPLLICPDTWLLEIKESKEGEAIELSWTRVSSIDNNASLKCIIMGYGGVLPMLMYTIVSLICCSFHLVCSCTFP